LRKALTFKLLHTLPSDYGKIREKYLHKKNTGRIRL